MQGQVPFSDLLDTVCFVVGTTGATIRRCFQHTWETFINNIVAWHLIKFADGLTYDT